MVAFACFECGQWITSDQAVKTSLLNARTLCESCEWRHWHNQGEAEMHGNPPPAEEERA